MVRGIILLLLLYPSFAFAKINSIGETSNGYFDGTLGGQRLGPGFDFQVKWKHWTLLGDPVWNAKIDWKMVNTTQIPLPDEANGATIAVHRIPKKVLATGISIYNVKIRVYGSSQGWMTSGMPIFYEFDAGIPKGSGVGFSFNVPSASNWDDVPLFKGPKSDFFSEKTRATAEQAKSVLKAGFSVDSVDIVAIDYSFFGLHDWWRENYTSKKEVEGLLHSVSKHVESATRILDMDENNPLKERLKDFENQIFRAGNNAKAVSSVAKKLRKFHQKLADGLPTQYIPPERENLYHAERQHINQETTNIVLALSSNNRYEQWKRAKQEELDSRSKLTRPITEGAWHWHADARVYLRFGSDGEVRFYNDSTSTYFYRYGADWTKNQDNTLVEVSKHNDFSSRKIGLFEVIMIEEDKIKFISKDKKGRRDTLHMSVFVRHNSRR